MSCLFLPFLSELTVFHHLSFCFHVAFLKRISLTTLSKFLLSWGKIEPGMLGKKGYGILNRLAKEGLIEKLTFGKI